MALSFSILLLLVKKWKNENTCSIIVVVFVVLKEAKLSSKVYLSIVLSFPFLWDCALREACKELLPLKMKFKKIFGSSLYCAFDASLCAPALI